MTKRHKKFLYEHMVTHINHKKKTTVAYIENCREDYMNFVGMSLNMGHLEEYEFEVLRLPKKFVAVVKCPDDEKFDDEKYLDLAVSRLCNKYEAACDRAMTKYVNRIKNRIKF